MDRSYFLEKVKVHIGLDDKKDNFINVLDGDLQEYTKMDNVIRVARISCLLTERNMILCLIYFSISFYEKSISLKHCSPVQQSCPSLVVLERTIVGLHLGLFLPTLTAQGFEELSWQLFPNRHSND